MKEDYVSEPSHISVCLSVYLSAVCEHNDEKW